MRVVLWVLAWFCAFFGFIFSLAQPRFVASISIVAMAVWLGAWWTCGWILDDSEVPELPPD
jgi:hypothetical protein